MAFNLFFIMLIAYAGIAAGYALGKIAPEERKPLHRSVLALQHISAMLGFAGAWVSSYLAQNTVLMALFLALVLIIIYIHTMATRALKEYRLPLTSISLGIFLAFAPAATVLLVALCVFIFFTCLGVLETTSKFRSLGTLALKTFWFLAVALITLL